MDKGDAFVMGLKPLVGPRNNTCKEGEGQGEGLYRYIISSSSVLYLLMLLLFKR